MVQKDSFWKQFQSSRRQCLKMSGTSRRHPRRDVPSSRRWVNYYAGQQVATSQRLNVVTSQRRDVPTSRRSNVATSVRVLFSHHLKANRVQNWRYRETYGLGHENQSTSDIDLEEEPVICIISLFLTIGLMFYISHISILLVSMF